MYYFKKVIPMFLHILPAALHTIAIAREASLCPFQKHFVFARPAMVTKKFNFIVGSVSFFLLGSP
jgi:hypothetical protein